MIFDKALRIDVDTLPSSESKASPGMPGIRSVKITPETGACEVVVVVVKGGVTAEEVPFDDVFRPTLRPIATASTNITPKMREIASGVFRRTNRVVGGSEGAFLLTSISDDDDEDDDSVSFFFRGLTFSNEVSFICLPPTEIGSNSNFIVYIVDSKNERGRRGRKGGTG